MEFTCGRLTREWYGKHAPAGWSHIEINDGNLAYKIWEVRDGGSSANLPLLGSSFLAPAFEAISGFPFSAARGAESLAGMLTSLCEAVVIDTALERLKREIGAGEFLGSPSGDEAISGTECTYYALRNKDGKYLQSLVGMRATPRFADGIQEAAFYTEDDLSEMREVIESHTLCIYTVTVSQATPFDTKQL